jgi:hypothetical protein
MTQLISRIIAVVQVLGGLMGTVAAVGLIVRAGAGGFAFGALFIALYLLSVVGGILLWRGRLLGYTLSIVVQALQVLHVETARFAWQFVVGLAGWLAWASDGVSDGVSVDYDIASRFQLMFASGFGPRFDEAGVHLGLNAVAGVVLVYLIVARRRGGH